MCFLNASAVLPSRGYRTRAGLQASRVNVILEGPISCLRRDFFSVKKCLRQCRDLGSHYMKLIEHESFRRVSKIRSKDLQPVQAKYIQEASCLVRGFCYC